MAANDFTQDMPYHPLISDFTEDTLSACSHVLSFLSTYRAENCPGKSEKQGLSIIHSLVVSALEYEIVRVNQLRNGKMTS